MTSQKTIQPPENIDAQKGKSRPEISPSVGTEILQEVGGQRAEFKGEVLKDLAQAALTDAETPDSDSKSPDSQEPRSDFETFALLFIAIKNALSGDPAKLAEFFSNVPKELQTAIEEPTDSSDGDFTEEETKRTIQALAMEKNDSHIPRKIVNEALAQCGSEKFRGSEVAAGRLACAQVVSTILVNCGLMEKPLLGVTQVRTALNKKGWKEHKGPPKPGDVVIWNKTTKKTDDGHVVKGYEHIGIVIDPKTNSALSNSSREKVPRLNEIGYESNPNSKTGDYWYKRGIITFLSPPDTVEAVS